MKVFFTCGRAPVEEKECDAVDIVMEHLIIRVRNVGVDVMDKETKELLYSGLDRKG
jgi:hypothetical protein